MAGAAGAGVAVAGAVVAGAAVEVVVEAGFGVDALKLVAVIVPEASFV